MTRNGILTTLGLAGAAIAAGLLLEPKKGAKRRRKISRGAVDLYNSASTELTRLGTTIGDAIPGINAKKEAKSDDPAKTAKKQSVKKRKKKVA